ncbi:hypothetical protein KC730_01160, partial [Candidatus Kaiserbacteria bacterium]|nr:hypothetical protein [Candidatus Kaiserbacteria bacterium]
RSIFNIWVEQPTINKQERTISFAGGIPNGYCGRVSGDPMLTNVLAEIIFRSPGFFFIFGDNNETIAKIEFTDSSTAYLNDGYGTKASLISYPSTITLEKTSGQLQSNDWQKQVDLDEVPPEDFSIQLQKGDGNFLDRYYIVFNTTDKQTGIDRYQIMEEPLSQFGSFQWGRADAPWVTERSPYVLKDQTLNSIIRVKAIDKAGNEYIANLIPDSSIRTLSSSEIKMYFLIGVSILVIVIVIIFLWWFIRKRKRFLPESEESQSEIDAIPLEEGAIKLNHENK